MGLRKHTQAYLRFEVKGQSCLRVGCLEIKFEMNLQELCESELSLFSISARCDPVLQDLI